MGLSVSARAITELQGKLDLKYFYHRPSVIMAPKVSKVVV
jgi:hypothetical protein